MVRNQILKFPACLPVFAGELLETTSHYVPINNPPSVIQHHFEYLLTTNLTDILFPDEAHLTSFPRRFLFVLAHFVHCSMFSLLTHAIYVSYDLKSHL